MEFLPFGIKLAESVSLVRKCLFVEGEVAHGESSNARSPSAAEREAEVSSHLLSRHLCRNVSSVFWNNVTVYKA